MVRQPIGWKRLATSNIRRDNKITSDRSDLNSIKEIDNSVRKSMQFKRGIQCR